MINFVEPHPSSFPDSLPVVSIRVDTQAENTLLAPDNPFLPRPPHERILEKEDPFPINTQHRRFDVAKGHPPFFPWTS